MNDLSISKTTARRYVLGRQGLWPGRRWRGKAGVDQAIRQMEAVQVDSITVVVRNHEIVLWSRVLDYEPADLDSLLYKDRAFFDYGNILMIYPMAELRYWLTVMQKQAGRSSYGEFVRNNPAVVESLRTALREKGPLGNRDFEGASGMNSGRATKDTGLAAYYLWETGELMTHSRRNFERLYGLRANIAPANVEPATLAEAEAFFARKALQDTVLNTQRGWASRLGVTLHRTFGAAEAKKTLAAMVENGVAATTKVEGAKDTWYFPAEDATLLSELESGNIPDAWKPLESTTEEEVTLLAPLDNVIWDRTRLRAIFDFDYVWEVYKPAAQRRWGYYNMPILYGDKFVARLDPKLDRAKGALNIMGFWLNDPALGDDPAFVAALAKGIENFARFCGAKTSDLRALEVILKS